MRIQKIFTLICCVLNFISFAQWNQVYNNNSTTNDNIHSLVGSPDGGVIAVRQIEYIYSNDFGNSWSLNQYGNFSCGLAWTLRAAGIISKDTFCLSGGYENFNYFGATTTLNQGINFNCYYSPTTTSNYAINRPYIGRSGKTFITTSKGQVFYSSDFGINFTKIKDWSSAVASSFYNDTLGVVAKSTSLYHLNYSTNVWTTLSSPSGYTITDVQMVGDSTLYLIGSNTNGKNLFKSDNLGASWQKIFLTNFNSNNTFTKMYFVNENLGYIYGDKVLLRTTDGGTSWQIQRMGSLTLQGVYFSDINNGFIAGTASSESRIYKTTTGGGIWEDLNYFFMSNVACCANVICDLTATATAGYSYNWLLDGAFVGSGITPGTISASSGYHDISLIASNGSVTDTFTIQVYSAPPLPPATNINGNPDTTICYGSVFTFSLPAGSNSTYSYSMWEGGNLIYGPFNGQGGILNFYSPPLFDTTIITMQLNSAYYFCPGNTITRDFNVIVYPNAASEIPLVVDDSVCLNDTTLFIIPNTNPSYQYVVSATSYTNCSDGYSPVTGNGDSLEVQLLLKDNAGCTKYYYYTVNDAYGCSNVSAKIRVLVDSVHARLYTTDYFGKIGDTVHINNNSQGNLISWHYDNSYLEQLSFTNASTEYKILSEGNSKISLYLANDTGCEDSTYQIVNGFEEWTNMQNHTCNSFISTDTTLSVFNELNCHNLHRYNKILHVDKEGNMYFAGMDNISNQSSSNYRSSTISKYSGTGNLIWKKNFLLLGGGVSQNALYLNSIGTDSLGNCYVTGKYNDGLIYLDNLTFPTISGYDPGLGFIVKINKNGIAEWANIINYDLQNQTGSMFNVKVRNNNTIVVNVEFVRSIYQLPSGFTTWNYAAPDEDGFLVMDSLGNINKHIAFNDFKDHFFSDMNYCYNSTSTRFPYGMDYEIVGNRIYILTLHAFYTPLLFNGNYYYRTANSNTGEGIGIVSVFDLEGNSIRDFEVFRYARFNNMIDNSDAAYYTGDDWLHHGLFMTEPKLAIDGFHNIFVTFSPYATKIYGLFNDTISKGIYSLITPQTGEIKGMFRSSLLQKFDSTGTPQFTYLNKGLVIKDIGISQGGKLNGIGDYSSYYSLESSGQNFYGDQNDGNYFGGLFFSYHNNGDLESVKTVASNGLVNTVALTTIDTCNSNVFFSFVANDTAYYDGQIFDKPYYHNIIKVNNQNNCSDISYCPWYHEPVIINNIEEVISNIWNLIPNPTTGFLNVFYSDQHKKMENFSLVIFNSIGQKVLETKDISSNNLSLDVSNLENGLYHLFIFDKDGNKIENLNFVKQ